MSACISETLIYERGYCVMLVHTHQGFPLLEYCQDWDDIMRGGNSAPQCTINTALCYTNTHLLKKLQPGEK